MAKSTLCAMPLEDRVSVWGDSIRMENWPRRHGVSPIFITSLSWWLPLDNSPVIWIVEDDPSTQRIVAQHLKASHFRPVLFDTAEKAYAALRTQTLPALI